MNGAAPRQKGWKRFEEARDAFGQQRWGTGLSVESTLAPYMNNSPCIQRFLEHVQLKDLSLHTQKAYCLVVRRLAEYYQADPAGLSEAQVRTSLDLRP